MNTFLARFIFVVIAVLAFGLARAVSPSAINGSYYDPNHSGHGFSIEALDDGRAIAWWYVYDRDGNPVHLYIEGPLQPISSGELRLNGRAYLPRGMRFGSFDPADVELREWGDVVIDIGCDRAYARYNANGPAGAGFGTGPVALQRLSAIKGILRAEDCVRGHVDLHDPVILAGTSTFGDGGTEPMFGVADERGRVLLAAPRMGGPIVTAVSLGTLFSFKVDAEVRANVANESGMPRSSTAIIDVPVRYESDGGFRIIAIHSDVEGSASREFEMADLITRIDVDRDVADTAALHRPFNARTLAGKRFTMGPDGPQVIIDAAGNVCVARYTTVALDCQFTGKFTAVPGDWAFFDFELAYRQGLTHAPVKGRGWVLYSPEGQPRLLAMVGTQGGEGFAFSGSVSTP